MKFLKTDKVVCTDSEREHCSLHADNVLYATILLSESFLIFRRERITERAARINTKQLTSDIIFIYIRAKRGDIACTTKVRAKGNV
jgi:hypothetical protein